MSLITDRDLEHLATILQACALAHSVIVQLNSQSMGSKLLTSLILSAKILTTKTDTDGISDTYTSDIKITMLSHSKIKQNLCLKSVFNSFLPVGIKATLGNHWWYLWQFYWTIAQI